MYELTVEAASAIDRCIYRVVTLVTKFEAR